MILMKIYVITLSKSSDRQESIKSQFDNYNIPFEFVFGIDGKSLTETEKNNLYDCKKAKKICKELLDGEIGCALSHKLIYEKMIKDDIKRAIILEDDVIITAAFVRLLQHLNKIPIRKYVIKLEKTYGGTKDGNNEKCGYFTPWHRIKLTEEYFIGQPLNDPFLTSCYYIDIDAARILYSIIPKVFLTSDAWFYYRKFILLRMINKAVVSTDDSFYSTIVKCYDRQILPTHQRPRIVAYLLRKIKKLIKYFMSIFS